MATEQKERRLTSRVLHVWKKIATDGLPKRSQVDPTEFGADWANCLMIDIDAAPRRSRFSYVGNALHDPTCPIFDRQPVSECLEGSLLALVTRHIPRLLNTGKPVSVGGSAVHDEMNILYRTILLPLSENGQKMDGILAAVAYREITVASEIPITETRPVIVYDSRTDN